MQILHKGARYGTFPTTLRHNVSAVPRRSATVRVGFDGGLYTVHTVHFFSEKKYNSGFCFDGSLWVFVHFVECVFKAFPF